MSSKRPAKQACLAGFLQSTECCSLKAQICFEGLSDFSLQTLEGPVANGKFSGLLLPSNSTELRGTRPARTRFLHPSSRGRAGGGAGVREPQGGGAAPPGLLTISPTAAVPGCYSAHPLSPRGLLPSPSLCLWVPGALLIRTPTINFRLHLNSLRFHGPG